MGVCAIIPARYASTRLPGKPLLADTGKPLIQHVVEAVGPARRVDRVVVATDDRRILEAVQAFGGEAVMTREDHASGTDRLAEAAGALGLAASDIVVNVQGDEPDVPAESIDALVALLECSGVEMATLATPLPREQAADPNRVKVVLRDDARALYFSRAAIPHDRDGSKAVNYLLHLGLYAYRREFLDRYAAMPPAELEKIEQLEQLRVLAAGHDIAVEVVDYHGHGIDTPEDYAAFVARMRDLEKRGRTKT